VARCQLDTWQNFNFFKILKKLIKNKKKFKKKNSKNKNKTNSKNPEADTWHSI